MLVSLLRCLFASLYAQNIVIVTLFSDICPVCRTFFCNSLLVSKPDLCHSLHTGRPESAEASHVDGDNCHCHIWNLLGA